MKKPVRTAGRARFGLALISLALALPPVFPCSTFVLRDGDHIVFGRNYDWPIGYGLVFVNQAGVRKYLASYAGAPGWTSKYGSVSFNQYGKEQPMDGINEAGLVIALMMLS